MLIIILQICYKSVTKQIFLYVTLIEQLPRPGIGFYAIVEQLLGCYILIASYIIVTTQIIQILLPLDTLNSYWGWRNFFPSLALFSFVLFVLRFSFKVCSVLVSSLSLIILRLQHMMLQTFSAGHCKARVQYNTILLLIIGMRLIIKL